MSDVIVGRTPEPHPAQDRSSGVQVLVSGRSLGRACSAGLFERSDIHTAEGITVKHLFRTGSYTLTPIADTSDRFTDFRPYAVSLNNHGVVAFQATVRGGDSGVYTGSGGLISTVTDSVTGPLAAVYSHPDINQGGSACLYASFKSGGRGVVLVRDGQITTVAENAGPLGPTMNDDGTVAFRADLGSDVSGIFTGSGGRVTTIAQTSDALSVFHGLPAISSRGAVVFRADLKTGGHGIYVGDGGPLTPIAETSDFFIGLGQFPIMNDAGTVAFCATLQGGGSGVFTASAGEIATVIDTSSPFESFRGVLLNNAGRMIFYATPRGGELGVFTGRDPLRDCLLSVGASLFGSTIVEFALNPVSMNDVGQIAIRVKLANERQIVLRADPVDRGSDE